VSDMTRDVGSFIGGGTWFGSGAVSEVRDPGRTSEVVGLVRTATSAEVADVVVAARDAQPGWDALGVERRAALIRTVADLVEGSGETTASLLTRENGAILPISRREFVMAARVLRFAADHGLELLGQPGRLDSEEGWARIDLRPVGVVACIVPWNAPLILTAQKLGAALVTGNCVIVKPSPYAPLTIASVLREVAELLPRGVLNVVHGDAEVGGALISHPDVRKVSFTGGGATARDIMSAAAGSLTKLHFELGGNDPAIVLDDADLDDVAAKITAQAFRRSGQVCFAIKRVYAPAHLVGPLGDAIVDHVSRIVVGHGLDSTSTMGPLNNRVQFDRISGYLARLANDGSRVTVSGEKSPHVEWDAGYYVQPAVVHDPDPLHPIVVEEQFGPILPIVGYRDEEQAVEFANGTEFGLASSVWSPDIDRAVRVAERIKAGLTFINDHGLSELGQRHLPFGGVKASGIGWENSAAGLREYLDYHSIDVRAGAA
jgi:acyl-CoA reductase-like NAD-dependent aldehyde dehydrogenase